MREQMNARERMLAAINRQPVDRVPIDIWATPEVWAMLGKHFGDEAAAVSALHVDGFSHVGAEYVGPPLPEVPPDEVVDYWGIRR